MAGFQAETESGVKSAFSNVGKIVAAAFAGAAVVDFAKNAVAGAATLQKSMEAVKIGFGEAGAAVTDFNEKAAAGLGISAETGEAAAAKFAILFQNMGVGQTQAASMTLGMEKLAGSLSAIRGVDATTSLNALSTALLGNTRSLKQLGIAITPAMIQEEAMKLGLDQTTASTGKQQIADNTLAIAKAKLTEALTKYGAGTTQVAAAQDAVTRAQDKMTTATQTSTAALSPAARAQAIYALATQNLSTLQTEAAAHSGDLANQARKLSAEWSNAKDVIGNALMPAITQVVTKLADWFSNAKNVETITRSASAVASAFATVVKGLSAVISTVDKVTGGFVNTIKDLIALKLASVVMGWASSFKALAGAQGIAATTTATQAASGAMVTWQREAGGAMVAVRTEAAAMSASTDASMASVGSAAVGATTKVSALRGMLGSMIGMAIPIAIILTITQRQAINSAVTSGLNAVGLGALTGTHTALTYQNVLNAPSFARSKLIQDVGGIAGLMKLPGSPYQPLMPTSQAASITKAVTDETTKLTNAFAGWNGTSTFGTGGGGGGGGGGTPLTVGGGGGGGGGAAASLAKTLASAKTSLEAGFKTLTTTAAKLGTDLTATMKDKLAALHTEIGNISSTADVTKAKTNLGTLKTTLTAALAKLKSEIALENTFDGLKTAVSKLGTDVTPQIKTQMKEIQDAIGKVSTPQQIAALRTQMTTVKNEIAAQLTAIKAQVTSETSAFNSAWSQLASGADTAFQQATAAGLTNLATLTAAASAAGLGSNLLGGALTQTPAEIALANLQAAKTATDQATALAADQATLAADQLATSGATAAQLISDQQAVTNDQYNITVTALTNQANAERTAANQQLADAQSAYSTQRGLLQQQMDARVASIQAGMLNGTIAAATGMQQLTAVLSDPQYGIDMQNSGLVIGTSLYTGLQQGLKPVFDLISQLTSAMKAAGLLPGGSLVTPYSSSGSLARAGVGTGGAINTTPAEIAAALVAANAPVVDAVKGTTQAVKDSSTVVNVNGDSANTAAKLAAR